MLRSITKLSSFSKLLTNSTFSFSNTELINAPDPKYADHRAELMKNNWRDIDTTGKVNQKAIVRNLKKLICQMPNS